jgi:hypothetical protein
MSKHDTIVRVGRSTFTHFGDCNSQKVQHEFSNARSREGAKEAYIMHRLTVDFTSGCELPHTVHFSVEIRSQDRQQIDGVHVSAGGQEFITAEYKFNREEMTMVLVDMTSALLGHYQNKEFHEELVGEGKLLQRTIPMTKDSEGRIVFAFKTVHFRSEIKEVNVAVASPFAFKVGKYTADLNLQPFIAAL